MLFMYPTSMADRPTRMVPGTYPVTGRSDLAVEGGVVHDDRSTVALISVMFPPRPLADEPVLKMVDILVLENLFESRLRLAVESLHLRAEMPFADVCRVITG